MVPYKRIEGLGLSEIDAIECKYIFFKHPLYLRLFKHPSYLMGFEYRSYPSRERDVKGSSFQGYERAKYACYVHLILIRNSWKGKITSSSSIS